MEGNGKYSTTDGSVSGGFVVDFLEFSTRTL